MGVFTKFWHLIKEIQYFLIIDPLGWIRRSDGSRVITPNHITIFRGIMGMLAGIPYLIEYYRLSFILFTLAAWGDHLDGLYARRHKMESDYGAYLDRFWDKLLIVYWLVLICVASNNDLVQGAYFIIAAIFLATVEAVSQSISWYTVNRGGGKYHSGDNKATNIGKAKMFLEVVLLMFIIVFPDFSTPVGYCDDICTLSAMLCAILAFVSMFKHLKRITIQEN